MNTIANFTSLPIPIFGGQNYDFWKIKMKTMLRSLGLWSFVEDGYMEHESEEGLNDAQEKKLNENRMLDAKALFFIQQGVSDAIFPRILSANTSKEAWEILQQEFLGDIKAPGLADDQKKMRHGLDRITSLPDDIIIHILSFLDIKGAGRTSLLSQRWRNVWPKLVDLAIQFDAPHTSLDYQALKMRHNKYVEWVNQVVARLGAPLLNSFKVHFPFDINHSTHVDKWLEFAFQKGVRNLELNFSNPTCHSVRSHLYTPNSSFFMPFSGFAALKTQLESLILVGVNICGSGLQFILSNCHNLQFLSLKHNKRLSTLKIAGSSLKLKQLEIFCCFNLKELDIFANNLTSLLCWVGKIHVEYHHVPSLVEAYFGGPYSSHLVRNFHHLSGFSSQLEKLSLVSLREMTPPPIGFPTFANVKTLELGVLCIHGDSLLFLVSYLKACPLLHNFSLKVSGLLMPQIQLDMQLKNILENVKLIYLLEREGGLGVSLNWEDVLSLGEQQRLGMARLFFHKPKFAILDECTNATSVDVEEHLYTLASELGITVVTSSQRPALIPFHRLELRLIDGEGHWELRKIKR